MLEVIENGCSPYYLDTLKHHAMNANTWHLRYPNNSPDKHLKMDIIENEIKQPLLAGLAMGLLICLLYTSPSPRDLSTSRMPSSA